MSILSPKGTVGHLLEAVDTQEILKAAARSAVETAISGAQPSGHGSDGAGAAAKDVLEAVGVAKGHRVTGSLRKVGKPSLVVAGTLAGVTAVSAAVSAARRRSGS